MRYYVSDFVNFLCDEQHEVPLGGICQSTIVPIVQPRQILNVEPETGENVSPGRCYIFGCH